MSEQARFDVLGPKRLAKQGVIEQIYLTYRKIIGGAPIPVKQVKIVNASLAVGCRCHLHADASKIGP